MTERRDPFRVGFVEGVTPDKWARIWKDRRHGPLELILVTDADKALGEGVDMVLARLPVAGDHHVIWLYDERPVVVVPRDHPATAYDEIALAELDDVRLVVGPGLTSRQAIETVAAGTGVVVLPQSLARLHQRKDVTPVFLNDQEPTSVGLVWPRSAVGGIDERCDTFIGIVRGRTANSSRAAATPPKRARKRR